MAVANKLQTVVQSIPPRCRAGVHKGDVGLRGAQEASRWLWGFNWQVRTSREGLYSLKQSSLLWNDLLVVKLVTVHDMEQCKPDPCVLRLIPEGKIVLILTVHVDDMAVAGSREKVDKLLVVLNEDFTTNDLGELSFFTGCVFSQDWRRVGLS